MTAELFRFAPDNKDKEHEKTFIGFGSIDGPGGIDLYVRACAGRSEANDCAVHGSDKRRRQVAAALRFDATDGRGQ